MSIAIPGTLGFGGVSKAAAIGGNELSIIIISTLYSVKPGVPIWLNISIISHLT